MGGDEAACGVFGAGFYEAVVGAAEGVWGFSECVCAREAGEFGV